LGSGNVPFYTIPFSGVIPPPEPQRARPDRVVLPRVRAQSVRRQQRTKPRPAEGNALPIRF
jgi:hypothetical protein